MIDTLPTLLLMVLGCLYGSGTVVLLFGLSRRRKGEQTETPFVSIVIAARNEEDHIGTCLAAVSRQEYPVEKYEIILVNDRSSDRTAAIAIEWAKKMTNLRLFHVGEEASNLVGKKRALDLGILHSRGDIILTTDADCIPKPTWIRGMVKHFTSEVGLVAGYSYTEEPYERVPILQKLRSLERIAVAAVAAGSIGLRRGITCTGQNLAYRKQTYTDVGGFSTIGHLRSGDDDLFIQLVTRNTPWTIRYAFPRGTHVRTAAPHSQEQAIQQEKRRASKGFLYHPRLTALLSGIFLFYLLLFVMLCLSPFSWNSLYPAWIVFGMKAFLEGILIYRMCSLLGRKDLLPFFPIVEILHIPYVLLFGLWGTLGSYTWK
jgi:biofilm PGA synthesis N-glycosyltransferase PgaC